MKIKILIIVILALQACVKYNFSKLEGDGHDGIKRINIEKQNIKFSETFRVDYIFGNNEKKLYSKMIYNKNGKEKYWVKYNNNIVYYEFFFDYLNNSDTLYTIKEKEINKDTVISMKCFYQNKKQTIFEYNFLGDLVYFVEYIKDNNVNTKNLVYNKDSILVAKVEQTYNDNYKLTSSVKRDTLGIITSKLINKYENNRLIESKEYHKSNIYEHRTFEYYNVGLLKRLEIINYGDGEIYIEKNKYKKHLLFERESFIIEIESKDTLSHNTYYTKYYKK